GRAPPELVSVRAPQIAARVVGDGHEPGSGVAGGIETMRRAVHLDEDVLRDVLRLRAVPDQPVHETVDAVEVPLEERREGFRIASPNPRQLRSGRRRDGGTTGSWLLARPPLYDG